ncbi:pyridoxal-phosphate dependent enzyme [bacterium]|nr:pyridoxal-phosphate dependent enzyme [bacterium]
MSRPAVLKKTIARCRERKVVIPTFEEMRSPGKIAAAIQKRLPKIGLWDVDPLNLFRITWKNDVKTGLFGRVNTLEIPPSLTGVRARVIGLVGKFFPTGAHKVGAAFGCLAPRLVNGEFDPTTQKAVWPSTGNYCRGGAFDSALLDCTPVAILPEGMSRERFEWLKEIGAEVIATPGTESNVKEIYDKCWEIRRTRPECVIFNQFDEFGNPVWHYEVTGPAIEEAFADAGSGLRLAGYVSATGSAGTIAAGDYLRTKFPHVKVAASEALQCPTLLYNGFGAHRIEGIGDKHVPWIHNARNTDAVIGIDDEACMRLLRLFNEPAGLQQLKEDGLPPAFLDRLPLLGISGISNMLSAVKLAKFFELGEKDVVFTIFTDSSDLYKSRLEELRHESGAYERKHALYDRARYLDGAGIDHVQELGYYGQKRIHNLKYFTWVEQQGKSSEDLNRLWDPAFWTDVFQQGPKWDRQIRDFNKETGVLKKI